MTRYINRSFVKTITVSDTAEPLTASAISSVEFTLQAECAGADPVYIGDSTVDDTKGLKMINTWTITKNKGATLGDIYVYGKAGDKVRVFYTTQD